MASTYLTRTPSSAGTQTKFTFSFWVKMTSASNGADKAIFSSGLNSSNYYMIRFTSGDQLQILSKDNGNNQINYNTNQVFRDTNSWYHIVLTHDTTQSSGNRIKYYVNGEQVSSFQSSVEPSASANILYVNDTTVHAWGRRNYNTDLYTDMALSHVHFIDGTAYDASAFGETDATTGIWKPKTAPSVTYGTNGYFLKFENSAAMGTDSSNNSNNWAIGGGVMTKLIDTPSNIFATWNPLLPHSSLGYSLTYSYGNKNIQFNESSTWTYVCSTLGSSSGKYYFEAKLSTVGSEASVGILELDEVNNNQGSGSLDDYVGKHANAVGYFNNGRIVKNNNNEQTGLTALSSGSIVGVAMDLDNNTVQFYVNGSSVGSAVSINSDRTYFFGTSGYNSTKWECNFGNGYFADNAISSAGTNASNNGIFEYNVPSGYTALSTKGLNL